MSKLDKKIISIFLLIILLISQFSIVFAADYGEQETKKTLTQYLIENGVDENGDNVLSDAEWAKVKNLNLDEDIDITGIEKAVNLKSLEMVGINPATIDFSKLTKLESLYIYGGIPELSSELRIEGKKIKNLYLQDRDGNLEKLDISDLTSLENITIYMYSGDYDIVFPDTNTVKELNCFDDMRISGNADYADLYPELCAGNDMGMFSMEVLEDNISLSVGRQLHSSYPLNYLLNDEENDIFKVVDGVVYGKKVGTGNITFIDELNREHEITINVVENNLDTTLEDTGVTAEFIDDGDAILKSNGELWKVNSETTAEKIDTNVKSYISNYVYANDMTTEIYVENTLKNDNTLIVKYNGVEKEISNVKDMNSSLYLTEIGELYELNINYITEEIKPTKIMENVAGLYIDLDYYDCFYTEDDKHYRIISPGIRYTANNDYENTDAPTPGMGFADYCKGKFLVIGDDNGIVFKYEYDDNYKVILGDELLDRVEYIKAVYYYSSSSGNTYDILLREDGSIWTYSEQYGLTKITKSTVIEDEKLPVEEGYIVNPTIKDKEVGGKTAISGIGGNKKVEDFLNQKNFNEEYTVKVYNSQGTEVASSTIIGTGLKVKLVDSEGQVVQEYTVIVYGDTDGDGSINAFDALTLIKGINKKVAFKGEEYKEAGRIMTEGNAEPSAVDALAIVKAANNKYTINQSK